jgi:3-hydroxyisobutyrate dehydrogenase
MNTPSGPLIGLIGLGTMGSRMGRRLADRDVRLILYDSAPGAAARLAGHASVTVADDVTKLAGCDAVITMLPNGDAVRSAVLGGPRPLAGLLAPGSVVIDMSSSAPGDSVALAGTLARRDIGFIDAPVSGGAHGAQAGTLAIMAGGDERLIARWTWMFEIIGRSCVRCGPVGSGHALKALNNLLSAGGLLLAVEALAVGKRFGLSPSVMLEVINQSSGANNSTQNKLAQRVLSRSFDAGFTIGLMTKDLTTARDLARQVGVDVPLSARTVELWSEALAALGPGADHTAIARWFEDNHGVTLDDPR